MAHKSDTMSMIFLAAIAAIGVVGALSQRYGADSRPGFDEAEPLS
jgi:hypothetical protein